MPEEFNNSHERLQWAQRDLVILPEVVVVAAKDISIIYRAVVEELDVQQQFGFMDLLTWMIDSWSQIGGGGHSDKEPLLEDVSFYVGLYISCNSEVDLATAGHLQSLVDTEVGRSPIDESAAQCPRDGDTALVAADGSQRMPIYVASGLMVCCEVISSSKTYRYTTYNEPLLPCKRLFWHYLKQWEMQWLLEATMEVSTLQRLRWDWDYQPKHWRSENETAAVVAIEEEPHTGILEWLLPARQVRMGGTLTAGILCFPVQTAWSAGLLFCFPFITPHPKSKDRDRG